MKVRIKTWKEMSSLKGATVSRYEIKQKDNFHHFGREDEENLPEDRIIEVKKYNSNYMWESTGAVIQDWMITEKIIETIQEKVDEILKGCVNRNFDDLEDGWNIAHILHKDLRKRVNELLDDGYEVKCGYTSIPNSISHDFCVVWR